ncbi:MAG: sporulation protein YtfJ [Oscillospiraceae bacterium]|nr:sporulation protein YtfJ [Oscillospiraceae bacterium]
MNEKKSNLEGLVQTAIEKIKEVVDVDTVVGSPITVPNGTTIIPVSKVSVGFGSGGSDIPAKSEKDLFGGGMGGGVTVTPLAFITIAPDGSTKLLQLTVNAPKENAALATIPDVIDKVVSFLDKHNKMEVVYEDTNEDEETGE